MGDIGGEDAKVVFFDEEGHAAREEEKGVALKLKDEYLDKAVNLLGEGWLLPAEVASYYNCGVKNVISLQPFGCIANHIVVRGVEKRLKELYPQLNLLTLDFDSGVSDVNVTNRMLLFVDNLQ